MGKRTLSHRDTSKCNTTITLNDNEWFGDDNVNMGSLQRIADAAELMAAATELMATKYRQMESSLEFYRKEYPARNTEIERLKRSNAALRGVIKRMKKNL